GSSSGGDHQTVLLDPWPPNASSSSASSAMQEDGEGAAVTANPQPTIGEDIERQVDGLYAEELCMWDNDAFAFSGYVLSPVHQQQPPNHHSDSFVSSGSGTTKVFGICRQRM